MWTRQFVITTRIAVYVPAGSRESRVGVVVGDHVADLKDCCALYLHEGEQEPRPYAMASAIAGDDLSEFFSGGDRAVRMARQVSDFVKDRLPGGIKGLGGERVAYGLDEVRFRPPLAGGLPKVMCAGSNLADHASRSGSQAVPAQAGQAGRVGAPAPGAFFKATSNIIGDGDGIPYPARTKRLDYEGEVGIVVGRRGRDIPRSRYLDYAIGYTIFNDVSIRDVGSTFVKQGWRDTLDFNPAKNFDASGSLGPWITLRDEIPNHDDIPIITKVNGETRQNGSTKSMIMGFGEYMELLSADTFLNPGDVITTGTCAGTALDSTPRDANGAQDPRLFLKIGDTIEISSFGSMGVLRNKVTSKS